MDLHDDDDGELTLDTVGPQEGSYVEDQAEEQFKEDYRELQEMQREKESRKKNEKNASGTLSEEKTKDIQSQLEAKFAEFASRREVHWGATTSKGRNFLHYLAYERLLGVAYYPQALIKIASTQQPHLMGALDSSGRTPLAVAIAEENYYFCHNAVTRLNEKEARNLGEQLRSECKIGSGNPNVDGERITCLHAALSATFYKSRNINAEKFITKIINLVPKEMFLEIDSSGRTPLHIAVQYEKCVPSQERIVLRLLKEGPEALNCKIKGAGGSSLSIYQFHEESKTIWEKKLRLQMAAKSQKNPPLTHPERAQTKRVDDTAPGKEEKQTKPSSDLWKTESKKVIESTARKGEMLPPSWSTLKDKPERINKPDANVAVRRNSVTSTGTPLTERRAEGPSQIGASPVIKAQDAVVAPAKAADRQLEDHLESLRETAAAVSELLKLFCLRNNEPDIASRFLRSPDGLGKQDKALWFDFGPQRRLSMKEFTRGSFQYFEFESILQYVAFPRIQLVTKQGSSQEQFPMVALFNWLRAEGRGVKRIIRVIVDDLESPSHTDAAIEQSLAGFKVEVLDWRRKDLCPASLAKVGDHLREVSLYWSGSNPVLRAWSEPDGLARLPILETINIIQVNVTESEERINQNLEDFKKRLKKSCFREGKSNLKPKVLIHPQIRGLPGDLSQPEKVLPGFTSSNDKTVDSHKWIECMKRFSNEFRQIKELREAQDKVDSRLGPVVVALIDDGTDIHHQDLDLQKKFDGESFYKYNDRSGARMAPWWHSESGYEIIMDVSELVHGTLMARLIAGICPSAIIHVIKLHTFCAGSSSKLHIDPDSAVEAIAHAVKLGAHIISMSWTIMPPDELLKKKQFTDAITSTIFNSKDTLMFCAASDQGKYPDRTYPHAVKSNIFRIGAAAATGKISDTVGDQQSLSFILPGQDVVIDNWYDDVEHKTLAEFEAHTGSSVATALAAGLAALIIECVRLGVIHTNNSPQRQRQDPTLAITVDDLEQIRDHETMRAAMSSIGTDSNTDHLYLKVWEWFDAGKLKAAKRRPDGELEFISGLARHFLRKGIT